MASQEQAIAIDSPIVVDATDHIAGRLSSNVAKLLLKGNRVSLSLVSWPILYKLISLLATDGFNAYSANLAQIGASFLADAFLRSFAICINASHSFDDKKSSIV